MTSITPAVFLDFDGTITARDATDAILDAFADPRWLDVEEAWKSGRIGSRECLTAQMALVSASPSDVDALLDGVAVDPGLVTLLRFCIARSAPVHIISDGFDYCIGRILGRPSLGLAEYLKDVPIVSSHLEPEGVHWRVTFSSPRQPCPHGCATCKPAAMKRLNADARPTVFVGDGLSDRYAAGAAGIVFAKDKLAEFCVDTSLPYIPYDNLATVACRLEACLGSADPAKGAFPGKAFRAT
jgi:2-hydroxy-3-keto-5-methylthiopentenyl-1-phosphate phosphatase